MLAAEAGVNLQAIPYHFGSKEGLFLAAAEYIGSRILATLGPAHDRARARLGGKIEPAAARSMLIDLLTALAGLMLDESSAPIARFIVREQMEPSEAFEHLYSRVMEPKLELARKLVAVLIHADPRSTRARLRTLSLIGSVIFLRTAHAAAMRQLGWSATGPREFAAVRALIQENVACLADAQDKDIKRGLRVSGPRANVSLADTEDEL